MRVTQKSLFKTQHPRQNILWRGCLLCIYYFWVTLYIDLIVN